MTNNIYEIAGSSTNTVFRATIDGSGNVGTFSTDGQPQLPIIDQSLTAATVTIGGTPYIYVLGGNGAGPNVNSVWKTQALPTNTVTIANNGNVGIGTIATATLSAKLSIEGTQDLATLGANLITNGTFTGNATGWTLGTGWSYNSNNVIHSGGAGNLSQNINTIAGASYAVRFDVNNNTNHGCFSIKIGQAGLYLLFSDLSTYCAQSDSFDSQVIIASASGSFPLIFSSDATFNGTIDNVSVQQITTVNPLVAILNSDGSPAIEIRSGGATLYNTYVGLGAGQSSNGDALNNSAFGAFALQSDVWGMDNTAIGGNALQSNTWGGTNTAVGYDALQSNTNGGDNTAVGAFALQTNTTGSSNLAIGWGALLGNTSGIENTAVGGEDPLASNTTGNQNSAFGRSALSFNTTGNGNAAFGMQSLQSNILGSYNYAFGYGAGVGAGYDPLTNAGAIGSCAEVDQSNSLVLGSINGVSCATASTNVGIRTTSPNATLDVRGQGDFGVSSSVGYAAPLTTSAIEANLSANSLITFGESAAGNANPAITMYRTTAGARTGTATRIYQPSSTGDLYFQAGTSNTAYGSETYTTNMTILHGGTVNIASSNYVGTLQLGSGVQAILASAQATPFTLQIWNGSTFITPISIASSGYVTFCCSHNDLAENYLLNGSAKRGNIIGSDPTNKMQVTIANNNQSIMGIISTKPGAVMDADGGFQIGADTKAEYTNEKVPIAAVGSVPVIITGSPGSISNGDAITLSRIPGVGAKANNAGRIVGNALESNNHWNEQSCPVVNSLDSITWPEDDSNNSLSPCFRLPDGTYVGKIMVFLNISWDDQQVQLTSTGDLNFIDQTATADANFAVPHYFTLNDALGNPVQRVGEFSDAAIANLRVGLVSAQQVTTNALSVATENFTIGGQNIRDYIASIVNQIINSQSSIFNNNVVSPIASADEIHTNFISPLADNSNISVSLHDSKFMILNSSNASGSAVATIDNQGNASFSGQLTSNSLNTGDATISGTLHAGKVIADNIEGLDKMVNNQLSMINGATSSATYVTNVTNVYNSTPSGNSNFGLIVNQATPNTNSQLSMINGQYLDISSYSGQLAYVDNLSAGNAAFSQGLMVFGPTSLSDTSVVGQLSIDGSLILANNSINVLGSDLNLQPLRQGGLSIMAGLFYIDTEGNLKVGGNAEFAKDVKVGGTLSANIISPLPGNDLTLGNGNSNLEVKGTSNSAALSVNPLGDLIASGAATIAKLNLSLIQPAFAVSPSEVIATGSAGTAQITAHQTEVTIDNSLVTDKSLIYITPTSNTNNQVLYLLRQVPRQSFTVGLQNPSVSPIPFNWIIVN